METKREWAPAGTHDNSQNGTDRMAMQGYVIVFNDLLIWENSGKGRIEGVINWAVENPRGTPFVFETESPIDESYWIWTG